MTATTGRQAASRGAGLWTPASRIYWRARHFLSDLRQLTIGQSQVAADERKFLGYGPSGHPLHASWIPAPAGYVPTVEPFEDRYAPYDEIEVQSDYDEQNWN